MIVAGDELRHPLDARHLGPAVLARYVREHGLQADRRLSQNFLADGEVLDTLVAEAHVTPGRRILEIGPGPGILTAALLAAGAEVTAVEVDRRMVDHLRARFGDAAGGPLAQGHLRLIHGDALDQDLAALVAAPWDLVANLPYHITSPTLHRVLGPEPRPARFVLMLQREVAERIAAAPGGLSYLSVFVQYHAHVRVARIVPPQAFEPAPEVASAILVGEIVPRRLEPAAEEDFWRLVQAGFRERRKMLHNVLPRQLPIVERATLLAALERVAIEPRRRPQTLSVDEWLALAAALGPLP
ncbi:MAG TPA: 16S rRNA (adenine(1518)-N(6)/adenine(1519)-N(6))-dimethyltransferase RsmA [Candidatus Sulfotelmatobacter sp.]|nr:16S rRNA (adenine(1518)-N(6)/adenine(1519)-N(6))-dimethyltransferase RsmA [Candidatus Sulfotelmatobacter sp.]